MCRHILLTAFEPFGGESVNPALEIARLLEPRGLPGIRLRVQVIPVTFRDSAPAAVAALESDRFDAVVMLGQAGGRDAVTVERIAINMDDASIPDNAGEQPVDRPIEPNGPDGVFSTLPVRAMADAMRAAGVPAKISNSAGTFVCNHLMYSVLRHPACAGIPAGFIHVPYLPGQAAGKPGAPSMSLEDMTRAVAAALAAL